MKSLVLILLLFISNNFSSQNHRFFYTFEYKIDTTDATVSDLLVLNINEKENLFISNKFIETDSINNINFHKKDYVYPQYSNVFVYSKKNKSFTAYKKLDIDYYKYDFHIYIDWKIESQKKDILGFSVQKATCRYGGRNWTAWFCPEINLPYGPYVFYGLPGMILEVYDDKNNFHYSFVKNSNSLSHNFKLESIFEQKPILIDQKDWATVQINYYNNPLYIYKTVGWVIHNKKGEPYNPQDYRILETQIKNSMKRYNNPIELSEKINFN